MTMRAEIHEPERKAFLPGQIRFMQSVADELLYSGAFGAGKSRILCEKGMFLSLKYPNNFGLITRKRFNDLKFTTMDVFFRDVLPKGMKKGTDYFWNATDNIITFKNGSQIIFRGLDDPLKIASMNLGWAGVDEATEISEYDWDMINGRLRLLATPFHQVFGSTNPGPPAHWLYQRFVINPEKGAQEFISSNALENTYLPDDYIIRINRYKGRYYDRYVLGMWVGFEGIVYDNFDEKVNLMDSFDIPADWPKYRSIDFGFSNPFVCQWWARCPDDGSEWAGHWFMYQELYKSQVVVEDHAKIINAHSTLRTGVKETYINTFCDWDAEDRMTLAKHGIPANNANKDVSPGIQTCFDLMGEGKIHIFRDSLIEQDEQLADKKKPTSFMGEVYLYEWQKPPNQNRPGEKNVKEEPRKYNDHSMDAMRMVIHTVEFRLKGGNQVRDGRRESQWPMRMGRGSFAELREDSGAFAEMR